MPRLVRGLVDERTTGRSDWNTGHVRDRGETRRSRTWARFNPFALLADSHQYLSATSAFRFYAWSIGLMWGGALIISLGTSVWHRSVALGSVVVIAGVLDLLFVVIVCGDIHVKRTKPQQDRFRRYWRGK
jgi:hypothetical protein